MADPMTEPRTDWLDVIHAVAPADYTPLNVLEDLPNSVYFTSPEWDKFVFRPGFGPHGAKDVHRSYHLATEKTWDLFRHEYSLRDVAVTVIECSFAMHIRFEEPKPDPDPLSGAAALAGTFLNLSPTPVFQWIQGDPKYRVFTSAPDTTLTMIRTFDSRIDGEARDDGISLVCYKFHPEFEQYISARGWFDDAFRKR